MELESEEDLKIAIKKDRETMGHRYVEGTKCRVYVSFYVHYHLEIWGQEINAFIQLGHIIFIKINQMLFF